MRVFSLSRQPESLPPNGRCYSFGLAKTLISVKRSFTKLELQKARRDYILCNGKITASADATWLMSLPLNLCVKFAHLWRDVKVIGNKVTVSKAPRDNDIQRFKRVGYIRYNPHLKVRGQRRYG